MNHKQFVFESYAFDLTSKVLTLNYKIDNKLSFTEIYTFDFDFVNFNNEALDIALQHLFFIAGVSYYKTYVPPEIIIRTEKIDTELASFLKETYQKGLGEFFYVNNLNPQTQVPFPAENTKTLNTLSVNNSGILVAVGGGKDSLVSIELLKDTGLDIASWSLNHRSQLEPLVDKIGLPHYYVERTWDPQLASLNLAEAYNGHVPISAIFACVGTIVAILTGKRDVVMSNERSADEPTLSYKGTEINHQYSKSSAFEKNYQNLLNCNFGDSIRYYSLLRPLGELQIAKIFAKHSFAKYKDVFSSCNKAFRHGETSLFWCGACPKCAFVYLALAPYVPEKDLMDLFDGKNVLLNPDLINTYKELLGLTNNKPLECVGDVAECRWAMKHMQNTYTELNKYNVPNLGIDDVWKQGPHAIPQDIYEHIENKLTV